MTTTSLQIVQNFQQSMGMGTTEWQNLFAEDIHFKGPVADVKGKEANIKLNIDFFPSVKGYTPIHVFEQGSFVSLEGTYTLAAPSGKTIELNMSEIYEIQDGKIKNIRVYYDAEEFRREFEAQN